MAANRILALNIGASQITLAEFKVSAGSSPVLLQYGSAELGVEPDSDADSSAFVIDALRRIMSERGIRPAPLLMSVSGQAVFPRFVKLPPVTPDKVLQMVQYEAEQNVPFPIAEVVWDYQLIGDAGEGEQNAMIVAVKTENIISLTNCAEAVKLEPAIVDVAPLAIANCVQANYSNLEGCTMVLDIGARSTNLIFLEDGRVFYRSIPVAGNAITQEIAKAFQIEFREAEALKREKGFVALGGVFASEDEEADKLSKIIRNVVTRLHAEVNRSVSFYRSQQGGSAPARILLTGGSSTIQHMDTFFREKLKVEVEYLNPFSFVEIGGNVNPDKVGEDFYSLCEVVGLAMRKSMECQIQINLMPPNLVQQKVFRKRLPFIGIASLSLIGAVVVYGLNVGTQLGVLEEQSAKAKSEKTRYDNPRSEIKSELEKRDAVLGEIGEYQTLVAQRTVVLQRIDALRAAMLDGMWLVSVVPIAEEGVVTKLEITGRGFDDKLKAAAKSGNKTAIEIFRDRLASQKVFTDDVKIKQDKVVDGFHKGEVKEFKLEVGLAPDFIIRKAGE